MTIESDHLLLFTNESKIGRLCSNFEKGTLTVFYFIGLVLVYYLNKPPLYCLKK